MGREVARINSRHLLWVPALNDLVNPGGRKPGWGLRESGEAGELQFWIVALRRLQ